ncbi:MAG: hypothetical protein IT461_10795 [Planctomycetes bacterium]|jgi:hypothetical protein|nr:hypothetical protein [Planctomycetota bacterium]
MGVFSRTMLMLAIAWLVGINVAFIFLHLSPEPDWRDKWVAEANIRRAIAYRYVDIKGGVVGERGFQKLDSVNEKLDPEALGQAPYGLPDEGGSGGSADPLPGSKVAKEHSLVELEVARGNGLKGAHKTTVDNLNSELATLEKAIAENLRAWRTALHSQAISLDSARKFGAEMQAFRYIIASFQQKVFNLDYEIQRVIIERDALTAELAQVKNDIERIKKQEIELEDVYYELNRGYSNSVKIIGMYEQLEPNIRRMADMAGRPWLHGHVIAVGSSPSEGVVTISIGRQHGVEFNQTFTIHRGGKVIGKMVVEHVEDTFSVGRLVSADRGRATVLENDSIKAAATFGTAAVR